MFGSECSLVTRSMDGREFIDWLYVYYLVNIYFMELFTVLLSYLVNYTFECPLYTSMEEKGLGVWRVPENLLNKQI